MAVKSKPPSDLVSVANKKGGVNAKIAEHYGCHRDTSRKWLKEIGYKYNPSAGPISTDEDLDEVLRNIHDSIRR